MKMELVPAAKIDAAEGDLRIVTDVAYEGVGARTLAGITGSTTTYLKLQGLKTGSKEDRPYHCLIRNVRDIRPGHGETKIFFRCQDQDENWFIGFVTQTRSGGCITHFLRQLDEPFRVSPEVPEEVTGPIGTATPPVPNVDAATGRFQSIKRIKDRLRRTT